MGRVAIVTGAGRGLGEGIAKAFAGAGAKVVVAARRTAEIDRVARQINAAGGAALAVTTDVTDQAALERLAVAAKEAFGDVNIWVNNAGGSFVRSRLAQISRKDWDETIALNLTAVWAACAVAAKVMTTGSIINVSSLAAYGPVPSSGHYAACKAAVNSLTRTLAVELAPRIRVNGIAPGSVPTEVMMAALELDESNLEDYRKRSRIPRARLGTPDDIGAAALYFASDASSWVTGQTLIVSGGQ
jgi:NAD(P)-dependent dehydrogenase (short-subunit alcohol dehydrogenase family)